eukprot:403374421
MKYQILSTLLLALLTSRATAFWQQGHLMVARVAYNHLQSEAPEALKAANDMLAVYSKSNPSMTKLEGDYPFVECATFADEIKAKGGAFQSGWHFIDTPYLDQGGSISDYPQFKFDENHIGKVIPAIVDWLSGTEGYENSFVYQAVQQHVENEEEGKSYALRLLIHYLGDIHQPLHATSRVDHQYPKGDAGGNFFHVAQKGEVKNLHSLWDSVVYEFTDTPSMPYNSNGWNKLGSAIQTMASKFTFPNNEYNSVDVNLWVNESFEVAQNAVYANIKENQAASDSYVQQNQKVIEKQIIIGGLRLATVIKQVFGNNTNQAAAFLQ